MTMWRLSGSLHWREPEYATNETYVFSERPKLKTWLLVSKILYPIYSIWFTFTFVLCLWKLKEVWKQKKSRTFLAILGVSFAIFACAVYALVFVYVKFDDEESSKFCVEIGGPLVATFYAVAQGCTYLLFIERSNMVDKSMEFSRPFKIAQLLAKYGTLIGIPGIVILVWFLWKGQVVSEGNCLMLGNGIISLVMGIADTGLSLVFLFLFAMPLINHSTQVADLNMNVSSKMYQVAKRNMILSFVAIVSTFISMMVITAFNFSFNPNDERYKYLQATSHVIGVSDLFVNSICVHLMTACWIPRCIQKYFSRFYLSAKSSQGTSGGSMLSGKRTNKLAPQTSPQNSAKISEALQPVSVGTASPTETGYN